LERGIRWSAGAWPPRARILCLNANRGFLLDRDYLADSFFEASQIADWLAPASSVLQLRQLLAARGISHILFEHRDHGIKYPRALMDLMADPGSARLLYPTKDELFEIYELIP